MTNKPSRFAAVKTKIVDSIRPAALAEVEKIVNDQLPNSASHAEVTNLLFAIAKNHPAYFDAGPQRGLRNQPEFPSGVDHIQDALHGHEDFAAMTAEERLAWVEANPAQAKVLLDAAKARKSK
jgi:hypothetical protein